MNKQALMAQLQLVAGGSLVMSTDQLARSLSMNPKVISRMRQEGRFPIAHKAIGSKIVYPIASVAGYLLNESLEPERPVARVVKVEPEKRRVKSAKAPIPDLSRKMLRIAFLSTLEAQQDKISEVLLLFKRQTQAEELNAVLPAKPSVKVARRGGKV